MIFPDLELKLVDGSTLELPGGLGPGAKPSEAPPHVREGGWSVILFYRGHF